MINNALYRKLLEQLTNTDIFVPGLPDETAESTLKALWLTATGNNCSAQCAIKKELPVLSPQQEGFLSSLISQRLTGTPLTSLTSRVNFMGLELLYEPGVLAPRPETELLGFTASKIIGTTMAHQNQVFGIDIGCGCGNISCGISSRHPELQLFSVDITQNCVKMTQKNISFQQLEDRITVFKGDLFMPLHTLHIKGTIDIIVSNPPYIPSTKLQSDLSHLLEHEPKEAFDGGVYGFAIHQRLIKESLMFLKSGGYLLFEFGIGQEKQVQALFKRVPGYDAVTFKNDAAGNPRVAVAIKN